METKNFPIPLLLSSALLLWPVLAAGRGPVDPDLAAVKRDSSPLYSTNSPDAGIVKVFSRGDLVRVRMSITGSEGTWCLVFEEGNRETAGYVSCEDLEYLHPDSPESRPGPPGREQTPSAGEMSEIPRPESTEKDAVSPAGMGSLLQAIWKEDLSAIKELLARGVNPDARTAIGSGPLHGAVKKGEAEITRLLIAHGADVNARDVNGLTPLMAAAAAGQAQNVETLLAAGARMEDMDEKGFTALMWAVLQGSPEGVAVLLENKAEVNAKSRDGRTALWFSKQLLANTRRSLAGAFRKSSPELVKELRTKLAKQQEIYQSLLDAGGKE